MGICSSGGNYCACQGTGVRASRDHSRLPLPSDSAAVASSASLPILLAVPSVDSIGELGGTAAAEVEDDPSETWPLTATMSSSMVTGALTPPLTATAPIPDHEEVERRFEMILMKMDLPPQKAKILRSYDSQKKWELVCDQGKVTEQGSPKFYLDKLVAFMDPKGSRKKKKFFGQDSSTKVLKHLEISLRTNSIDWVREFLDAENKGLQILVQYMKHVQEAGGLQTPLYSRPNNSNDASGHGSMKSADSKKYRTIYNRLNIGDPEDDIHVCIQCLRAIMNNTHGFNMVFNDSEAIYCLVRSILHPSLRTKTSVLILLAAICLVKGGHELIVSSFDRFKKECLEEKRFQTLFSYFHDFEEFHVDFMVACMQFINIIVHSVEDMNYRIFLQEEFRFLGLNDYLEKLRKTESEDLLIQISAYSDNMYDVGQLLEDSEQKGAYQQRLEEVDLELSRANEKLHELEMDYSNRLGHLDRRLAELVDERDRLLSLHQKTDNDLNTLRRVFTQKEQEARNQQSKLESRIQELENLQKSFKSMTSSNAAASEPPPAPAVSSAAIPPAPTLVVAPPVVPPPPPPAIPFPPALSFTPPIPPAAPVFNCAPQTSTFASDSAMTIKKRITTKYKLPYLNWTVLKPNQVKGTVFAELDDDRVAQRINFDDFEELFKLDPKPLSGASNASATSTLTTQSPSISSNKKETILDHKRLRNLAITKRKLAMESADLVKAINSFDLNVLNLEKVEILLRMLPTPEEVKAYKEYEAFQKPLKALCEEDRFMIELCKAERIGQKLQIMSFMGNFSDTISTLDPLFKTITTVSNSLKNARKFRKILEIILAYGNYMNSVARGGAYGFRLQSLDSLPFLRSTSNKSVTLMHALVQTVRDKFPELLNFGNEFASVEKASTLSLDSLMADVAELERGYELTKKECALRGESVPVLIQFLTKGDADMKNIRSAAALATESFRDCAEFFGETAKSTTTNSFFSTVVNFVKHFKQCDEENVARTKAEEKRQNRSLKSNQSNSISEVVNSLKRTSLKPGVGLQRREFTRKRDPGEMGLGTLDDIISDITREPYRDVAPKRPKSYKEMDIVLNNKNPSSLSAAETAM